MSDATIFVLVFGGLFILRAVAATVIFFYLLPRGDRCLNCDAPTVRVQSPFLGRIIPSLRKSWCMHCGWSGTLRAGPLSPPDESARGQTQHAKDRGGLGIKE